MIPPKKTTLQSIFRFRRDRRGFVDALNARAYSLLYKKQNFTKATTLSQRAIKIAEEIDYLKGLGWALVYHCELLIHADLTVGTYQMLGRSLEIFQKINDTKGEAVSYLLLGMNFLIDGDYISAYQEFERGLNLCLKIRDKETEKTALFFFGILSHRLDDYDESVKYFLRALQIPETEHQNAKILTKIGQTLLLTDCKTEAKSYLYKALAEAKRLEDTFSVAFVQTQLGKIFALEENIEKARKYLRNGLEIATKIGLFESSALVANEILESYLTLEDYQEALEILYDFKNSIRIQRNPQHLPFILMKIVFINLTQKNTENALELLNQVLQLVKNSQNHQILYDCYKAFADVFEKLGDYPKAVKNLRLAQEYKEILDRSGASNRLKIAADRVAIENLRRLTEANNLRADVGVVLASSTKPINKVFQECAEIFHRHLNLKMVSIWFFDKKKKVLNRIGLAGTPTNMDIAVVPITKFLVGQVATNKQPLFENDVQNCPHFADPKWAKENNINSFAGFPIIVGNELIGVLAIYSHAPVADETLRTVNVIADLMAQGIIRIKAHTELKTERDFFSKIIDSSTGFMFVFKPDGSIVKINHHARKTFIRKDMKKVIGRKFDELFQSNAEGTLGKLIKNFDIKNIGVSYELEHFDNEGNPRFIVWRNQVIWNKDSSVKYIVSNGTDLTEIRKSEDEMRKSEHKLRKLFDSSLVGMMICHLSGKIVEANDKFLDMLGYTRKDFNTDKLDWRKITPPGFEKVDAVAVQQCYDHGFATPFEKEYFHKSGKRIPVLIAVSGSIEKGLVAVFVLDLTESKKIEEELEQSRFQLLQSQKMEGIGRLAGGVSHDFNNLLTVINGYSEIALKKAGNDEVLRRNIEAVSQAGQKAASLTKQLLTFSRRQIIKTQPLDVNEIIGSFEDMLKRLIGEDIVFKFDFQENLDKIEADRGLIEQILLNLAVNAREAMPDGGKIEIKTENIFDKKLRHEEKRNAVKISFSDSGIGMSNDVKEKLFEPFFTTKNEGTGLGLATVYGIVSQFNGSIEVESSQNQGTTFNIWFPSNKSEIIPEISLEEQIHISHSSETILVVEDEPMVKNYTCEILKSAGYKTLTAENGKKGLEILNVDKTEVDLVLTDVVMPEMNGIAMIQNIRQTNPNVKVVFMSGYTDLKDNSYETVFKNEYFIQKPFSMVNLLNMVNSALQKNRNG